MLKYILCFLAILPILAYIVILDLIFQEKIPVYWSIFGAVIMSAYFLILVLIVKTIEKYRDNMYTKLNS